MNAGRTVAAGWADRLEGWIAQPLGALLLITLFWACTCLPALGKLELRGEEGRRVMPAVTMIETGDWLVPEVGGENYYNKPPLINWLIAGSIKLVGAQTEFAARLPSVVFVLLLVAWLVGSRSPWLSPQARFMAAILFLTNAGMVEKARLVELEAIYISLTGLAYLMWLDGFAAGGSRWRLWLLPAIPLGLGLLLKGPLILLFHYAVVIAVLAWERRFREFFTLPHLVGVLVFVGMFVAWSYPASQQSPPGEMSATWWSQMIKRVVPSRIDYGSWAASFLRAVVYLLPWAVLLPFLWRRDWTSRLPAERSAFFRGCRGALVACYLVVNLMPGTMSRYSMPLLPLACALLAWVLDCNRDRPGLLARWRQVLVGVFGFGVVAGGVGLFLGPLTVGRLAVALFIVAALAGMIRHRAWMTDPLRLSLGSAVFALCGMLFYSVLVIPMMVQREKVRPLARQIDASVPAGARLHVYSPGYQPALFYVKTPISYIRKGEPVGEGVRYLLAERVDWDELLKRPDVTVRRQTSRLKAKDRIGREYEVVEFLP